VSIAVLYRKKRKGLLLKKAKKGLKKDHQMKVRRLNLEGKYKVRLD
jgi:hypothetical protein